MPSKKVTDWLEKKRVPFEIILHPRRYTTLETAQAEHVPGHSVAKVVMVKADSKPVMIVIPADRMLDLLKLRFELETHDLEVEREDEFRDFFPDCEVGGMPPFGPLYGIPCYVDVALTENKDIYFNAGNHEESIKMATADFLMLAEAILGDFSVPKKMLK